MIAIDTNILVYAHRVDSQWHKPANHAVSACAQAASAWAVLWPCVHEFLAVVTHPRIYNPATPIERAIEQVDIWRESPGLVLLEEGSGYWSCLQELMRGGQVTGPRVHDARIAALCKYHGIDELWTADRDFSRFAGLKTKNPLV